MQYIKGRWVPIVERSEEVLFPGVVVALEVLEREDRASIDSVIDGHGRVAVSLSRSSRRGVVDVGRPRDVAGRIGQFPSTIGVGRILKYRRTESERLVIYVLGENRASISSLDAKGRAPWARLETLIERPIRSQMKRDAVRARLERCVLGFERTIADVGGTPEDARAIPRLRRIVSMTRDLGYILDCFGCNCLSDVEARQRLLEELDVEARAELLCRWIEADLPS
jgi:Lon protease-like protein